MGMFYFILILSRQFEQDGEGRAILVKILLYAKTRNIKKPHYLLFVWPDKVYVDVML